MIRNLLRQYTELARRSTESIAQSAEDWRLLAWTAAACIVLLTIAGCVYLLRRSEK